MTSRPQPTTPPPPRLSLGRTSGRVTWNELRLHGFGPFAGSVRVAFPDGLAALVGPNESGKSSLVLGLAAVLFGLRTSKDASVFGQARFRNQSLAASDPFWGELRFTGGDGVQYRLKRNFATHEVELSSRPAGDDGQAWHLVSKGTHNPGARRRNLAFERQLQEIIGVGSRELFWSTFCVNQPLPGMVEIDEAVQQLLSGAGGTGYPEAMETLASEVAHLTRHGSDLGVPSASTGRDRPLDEVRRAVERRARELAETAEALDALHPLELEVARLEADLGRLRGLQEAQAGLLDAWSRFKSLAEGRRVAQGRFEHLAQATSRAGHLREEAESLRAQLREEPVSGEDEGTGPQLEALAHLERQREQLAADRAQEEAALEAARRAFDEVEEAYAREGAHLEGRPDPVRALEELKERVREQASLVERLRTLEERARELDAEVGALPDFTPFGRPAVEAWDRLRREAREALRKWQRLQDYQCQVDAVQRELGNYDAFGRADAETLDVLPRHAALREQWLAQRYEAVNQLEQWERQRLVVQHEQTRLRNVFIDIASMEAGVLPAIETKIGLSERLDRVRTESQKAWHHAQQQAEKRLWLIVSMLVTGLAFGGLLPVLMKAQAVMSLLGSVFAAIVMGGLGWLVARRWLRDNLEELQAKRAGLEREIAQADQALGGLAQEPVHRLAAVKERWERFQERSRELDDLSKGLPSSEEMADATTRRDEADRALADLKTRLRGLTMQFPDPIQAMGRWQELRGERDRLDAERSAFCDQEWGVPPLEVADLDLERAGGAWTRLGLATTRRGRPVHRTVHELVRSLRELEDGWWTQERDHAEAWDRLTSLREEVQAEQDLLLRPGLDGRTAGERLVERIEELRRAVAPFDERAEIEQVGRQVSSARDLELEVRAARTRVEALERRVAEQAEEQAALEEEIGRARKPVAALLEAAGTLPQARARWERIQESRQRLASAQRSLDAVLASWQADTLTTLQSMTEEARRACEGIDGALGALGQEAPDLPQVEEGAGPDGVREGDEALEGRSAEIRQDLEKTRARLIEARDRLSRLQGRPYVNVEVARRELDRLRAEADEMAIESEALACAWQEMKAAVDEFGGSHRERLEQGATRRFQEVSGRVDRRVVLDEGFHVSLEEAGVRQLPMQLSQGARDQLYLSLRLAISDVVSPALRLPFVFDDPFLNCDEQRLERVRQALLRMARDRQVIVLSHRGDLEKWGKPVRGGTA